MFLLGIVCSSHLFLFLMGKVSLCVGNFKVDFFYLVKWLWSAIIVIISIVYDNCLVLMGYGWFGVLFVLMVCCKELLLTVCLVWSYAVLFIPVIKL